MIRQGNGDILGTTCSVGSNLPQSNTLLEAYGPGSRCVVHGSQWTVNGRSIDSYGGGCYQVSKFFMGPLTFTLFNNISSTSVLKIW